MVNYLLIINAITYGVMLFDKYLAQHRMTRIPEKSLFGFAVFGGSLGCLLAMYTIRHKTRHRSFKFGIPAILLVQLFLLIFVI